MNMKNAIFLKTRLIHFASTPLNILPIYLTPKH